MKARSVWIALLALVGSLSAAEPTREMTFEWVDDSNPTAATLRQSGSRLIDMIGGSLFSEVERLISTEGLEGTVENVHLLNLRLPTPTPGRPRLTEFKLTSLRIRNPRNAPDPADLAALDHVQWLLRLGESTSRPLVQKVSRANAPDEWRIYRPIAVMPTCLLCHGPVESQQPAVRASMHRRFPEDLAVNYGAYDWRGIIRVSYELPAEAK